MRHSYTKFAQKKQDINATLMLFNRHGANRTGQSSRLPMTQQATIPGSHWRARSWGHLFGQMQRVEIIKALYRGARILILDEPTAVLTPQEVTELIDMMKKLREQRCSIIIITHKLKEVLAATDHVTVMRKGIVTGRVRTADTDEQELSNMMVGREVNLNIPKEKPVGSERILEVKELRVYGERGEQAVKGVSFSVKRGGILGVCGVEGNGQSELVNAITGLLPVAGGSIRLAGESVERMDVRGRRERGMSHIPEDRLKVGSAKKCTIQENLILNGYYRAPFSRHGILARDKIQENADRMISQYQIKVPDAGYQLGTLSGGNMQKVILAREIDTDPEILIAAQPTRGVDIGAIEYIRKELVALRDRGKGILLVSAELEEIMTLSDRIVVMYGGEIVGNFLPQETSEQELGLYMAGVWKMALDKEAL